MDRHSLNETITEPEIKWRMNPVLAGAGLYETNDETNDFEVACNPYSRIETNQLGKLVTECRRIRAWQPARKAKGLC